MSRLRRAADLSQDQLAVRVDVTKRYIQIIEAGQKCPTIFTLHRIKKALGCSFDELLGEK